MTNFRFFLLGDINWHSHFYGDWAVTWYYMTYDERLVWRYLFRRNSGAYPWWGLPWQLWDWVPYRLAFRRLRRGVIV